MVAQSDALALILGAFPRTRLRGIELGVNLASPANLKLNNPLEGIRIIQKLISVNGLMDTNTEREKKNENMSCDRRRGFYRLARRG